MTKLMEFLQPLMKRRAMTGKFDEDSNALYFQALGDVIDDNLEDELIERDLMTIYSKEFDRMLDKHKLFGGWKEGMQRGGAVKDQFGYGSYQEGGEAGEVSWDDPWGDNISIPHRNGEVVTGPEADEYSPFGGQGFESILYKGHTFQEIDTDQYNKEDIDKAIAWYQEAGQKTSDYIDKYSDDPKVMAAQERKMKEIQFMLQQLAGGQNASAMIQRGGFAGKFGY